MSKNDSIYIAIKIVLEIDPWLLDRIIEPYFDQNGNGLIWLYCKGHWKLFTCCNAVSIGYFFRDAVGQALGRYYGGGDDNDVGV